MVSPPAQHTACDADIGKTVLLLDPDQERLLRHEEIVAALGFEPIGFTTCKGADEAYRSGKIDFDAALVFHEADNATLVAAALLHSAKPHLPIILCDPINA